MYRTLQYIFFTNLSLGSKWSHYLFADIYFFSICFYLMLS